MLHFGKLRPLSWEELKTNPTNVYRLPEVQTKYEQYRKALVDTGESTEHRLFRKYPQLKEKIVILPNKFPYYTEAGIEQQVAWLPPSLNDETKNDEKEIAEFLTRWLKEHLGYSPVVFENPPEFRSVKNLRHLHIFLNHNKVC